MLILFVQYIFNLLQSFIDLKCDMFLNIHIDVLFIIFFLKLILCLNRPKIVNVIEYIQVY